MMWLGAAYGLGGALFAGAVVIGVAQMGDDERRRGPWADWRWLTLMGLAWPVFTAGALYVMLIDRRRS